MKLKFIFLYIILPFILCIAGCMEAKREADRCYLEGINYERTGDIEKAKKSYLSAIKHLKTHTEAHRKYQDIEISLGNKVELIEKYKKELETHPESPCFLYLFGRLMPNLEKRNSYYQKALEKDPNYLWAINGIGGEYIKQGKYDIAVKQLKKIIEIDSEFSPVHLSLAQAWFAMNKLDPALSEIKKYNELEPESEEGFELAGKIYIAKGDEEEGLKEWQKSIKLNPNRTTPVYLTAEQYLKTGKYEEALKEVEKIYTINPNHIKAELIEAKIKFIQNDLSKSATLANKVLRTEQKNIEALRLKAEILENSNKKESAIEIYNKILSLNQNDVKTLEWFGKEAYKNGNRQEAINYISQACQRKDFSISGKRILRDLLYFNNHTDLAEPIAIEIINQNDVSIEDRIKAGLIAVTLSKTSKAESIFKQIYEIEKFDEKIPLFIYLVSPSDTETEKIFKSFEKFIKEDNIKKFVLSINNLIAQKYDIVINNYKKDRKTPYEEIIFSLAVKNINEIKKPEKKEKDDKKEQTKEIVYPKTAEMIKNIEKVKKNEKYGKTINSIAQITEMYLKTNPKTTKKEIEQNIKKLQEMQNTINDYTIYSYSKKEENRENNILTKLPKEPSKEKKEIKK